MKKILSLVWAVCLCTGGFAQNGKVTSADQLSKGINPWNLQTQVDQQKLIEALKKAGAPAPMSERLRLAIAKTAGKTIRRADENKVDTVSYFAATQSFKKNYEFNYEGGDVKTYNIGVAVNGTKVTFKNLMALYNPDDYAPSKEFTVDGVYDPVAKTITIPTATQFSKATVIGEIAGYLVGVLYSGTTNEKGELAPTDNLVFKVIGDFDAITTDQTIAVGEFTRDGSQSYGIYKSYRSYYAALPKAEPKLITFNSYYDFGSTFPNTPVTRTTTLINLGTTATDYAVTMESDDDAYTASPVSGTLGGQSTADVTFTLKAKDVADYEGMATIDYETEGESDPLMVQMNGSVTPFPDFSGAVKKGDFDFVTGIEYPFAMQTLADGTKVAASVTHGYGGATSWLKVSFNVPEKNIGTFSWKGKTFNIYDGGRWYSNVGGYFIDDESAPVKYWYDPEADISNSGEFGPGDHYVKFQYEGKNYTGYEDNKLYVYDLDLENKQTKADEARLETPSYDFGSFIVNNDTQEGQGELVLQNRGYNPLKVISVSSDNDAFSITRPAGLANLMEELSVPISFRSDKAGLFEGKLTVKTTGGSFEVPVKAIVRDMPDFKQIVTEGADLINFSTSPESPFIVENGVAHNASANQPDYKPNTALLQLDFEIPSDKVGYISWKGHSYGTADVSTNYVGDMSLFDFQHPLVGGSTQVYGDNDASSSSVFGSESWKNALTCIPGKHTFKFEFVQCGDTVGSEKDRLEISDIKLHVVDFPEHGAELLEKSVRFDSTYVGQDRYTIQTVHIHNTGSKPLQVTDVTGDAPFYGIVPKGQVNFDDNLPVELWFYPTESGDFTGKVTIKTTSGDLVVDCSGTARSSKGILLVGDIEDEAHGWYAQDADGDGNNWDLGFNFFGGYYPEWCHSGRNCMASASFTWENANTKPNNWLISPQVSIPEEGATLKWYAASHSKNRPSEHYSVYVEEAGAFDDYKKLDGLTPLFSETLDTIAASQWQEHTIDLKPYAGKTIQVSFRHHDCTGQYLLKVDDIFIYDATYTGIANTAISNDKTVARQEIFDLSGKHVNALQPGINIVRKFYNDGTVKTTKIFRRQ